MLENVQETAIRGARRAALGAVGLVLTATGAAFLTAALYMVLSALRDPAFAALVTGLLHAGAGALLLALSRNKPRKSRSPEGRAPGKAGSMETVARAFMEGFDTGKRVGRR